MSNTSKPNFNVPILLIVIFAGLVFYLNVFRDMGEHPAATESPEALTSLTPNPPPIEAVTKEMTTCYFGTEGKYFVTIPQFSIVSVLGKDFSGEWLLVTLEGFTDCWIQSSSVQLQNNGSLTLITTLFPPAITPIPSPTVVTTQLANQTPYPPIGLTWKILGFDCNNGKVTRAQVDLNVSGGVPPYSYSQELPLYARPEQIVSITVNSSTSNGEPSNRISFPIPRASDFKCAKEGDNTVPPPTIVPPNIVAPPTISPIPPPECRDGIDNDDDGKTDFPNDIECGSPDGNHEKP